MAPAALPPYFLMARFKGILFGLALLGLLATLLTKSYLAFAS